METKLKDEQALKAKLSELINWEQFFPKPQEEDDKPAAEPVKASE